MKNLFSTRPFFSLLSILMVIVFEFPSCQFESKQNRDIYQKVLGGKHDLRKFNVKTTTSQNVSAWYFLVMGGYSASTYNRSLVRFYFLNYKGEYQLKEMPLNQVNIKIDTSANKPFVKFYYNITGRSEEQWGNMYDFDVTKAVIYCKESDFQPEININDLK